MWSCIMHWCCIPTCNDLKSFSLYVMLCHALMLYSDLYILKSFSLYVIFCHALRCNLTCNPFNSLSKYVIPVSCIDAVFWLTTISIHLAGMWSSIMHWCCILTCNHSKSPRLYVIFVMHWCCVLTCNHSNLFRLYVIFC